MTTRVVLLSKSEKLQNIFAQAAQKQGRLVHISEDNVPLFSVDDDLVFIDTHHPTLSAHVSLSQVYGLYFALDKTHHFHAIRTRMKSLFPYPKDPEDAVLLLQKAQTEEASPLSLLNSHYSIIDEQLIANYQKLPNGENTLTRLFEIAQATFSSQLVQLRQALATEKFDDLAHIAHRIKSTFGNAGLYRLHIVCHWLEMSAEYQDLSLCQDLVINYLESNFSLAVDAWDIHGKNT